VKLPTADVRVGHRDRADVRVAECLDRSCRNIRHEGGIIIDQITTLLRDAVTPGCQRTTSPCDCACVTA
jgi:hypothetical protein